MRVAFAGLRHGHIYTLYRMMTEHVEFEVIGAFEENEEAKKIAASHGLICNYETYEEVLQDENVEAVALGGCYGDHGFMAIKALEAKKHVIADKPLCTSLEELCKIEALAKENGKCVSCMYAMRFEPRIRAVKKLVESGALGEINNVYFGGQHPLMYGRRPMWYFEEGRHGGTINDIAIHGIDTLSYMLGLKVDTIQAARSWNKYAAEEPAFLDSAQFMLTAKNGAGILGDVSYAIPDGVEFALPYYWQFYIWGTKGTIRFSNIETMLSVDAGDSQTGVAYYVKGIKETQILKEEAPETDYLSDFLRMVRGESDTVLPMQEVFDSARATLMIQQTAEQ